MEIQITQKKENVLLERTEVYFEGAHAGEKPPTRTAVREEIARLTNSSKDCVIVDWMRCDFGRPKLHGYAKVYKSTESAKKLERKHLLDRAAGIKAPKKEAGAKKQKPAADKK